MSTPWIRTIAAVAAMLVASTAQAATMFSLVSLTRSWDPATRGAGIGDTVTLGIRLSGGVGVFALGASAYGYDENVIDFVSGQSVASINHAIAIPAVGVFSGLANVVVPAPPPGTVVGGPLTESSIGSSGNRVQIFNGVGLTATNSNPLDPGLDGIIGGNDAQVRLTFVLVGFAGIDVVSIGTGYNGDGEITAGGYTTTDSVLTVFDPFQLVPEPGTAVLTGLGLAALAARRRPSA